MWALVKKATIFRLMDWLKMDGANWILHPLIHTLLKFTLPQYIVGYQGGAEAPHGIWKNE